MSAAPFSQQVSARFGRHAGPYSSQARLQQGVAWRLAHLLARELDEPHGPHMTRCASI